MYISSAPGQCKTMQCCRTFQPRAIQCRALLHAAAERTNAQRRARCGTTSRRRSLSRLIISVADVQSLQIVAGTVHVVTRATAAGITGRRHDVIRNTWGRSGTGLRAQAFELKPKQFEAYNAYINVAPGQCQTMQCCRTFQPRAIQRGASPRAAAGRTSAQRRARHATTGRRRSLSRPIISAADVQLLQIVTTSPERQWPLGPRSTLSCNKA